MITYRTLLALLVCWTAASFGVGVFVGRFIKFGMQDDEVSTRIYSFSNRRRELSATLTRRRL